MNVLMKRHDCQHICCNTIGAYQCKCRPGYILGPDGKSCQDLDECQITNGGCQYQCRNTEGSFVCSCPASQRLQPDGKSCTGDNNFVQSLTLNVSTKFVVKNQALVAINNGGCHHNCELFRGIAKCTCQPGYRIDIDGKTCIGKSVIFVLFES